MGGDVKTLDRRSLHKDVADRLTDMIVSAEYPEGSLLPPERQLCEQMGVSRTVIREAIKSMETQGLVQIDRGRGTVVREPQYGMLGDSLKLLLRRRGDRVRHLIEMRKILEVGVAALAAERRTEMNLTAMERCLAVMRQNPGKPEGYVDADVQFHVEIAQATQNPALLVLLEPLSELLRESRVQTYCGPQMVKLRLKQHEQIFKMIRIQDVQGARTAMSDHLADTERDLQRHLGPAER